MASPSTGVSLSRVRFVSDDADEVTDYIERMYVGNKTTFSDVPGSARFTAEHTDAGPIATDRLRCTIGFQGSTSPWDFFCSFVLDRGRARVTSAAGDLRMLPGSCTVYPLGAPLQFDMSDFGARVVHLPMDRLGQAAETMGISAAQLRLEGVAPVSAAMARYWRHLVGLVHGSLSEDDPGLRSPLLREELVQMTALAALHVFPNTTMSAEHVGGPGRVAPAVVRRAVAHIEANVHLPLTLHDIAEAAGTGARALQYAFRRHLGTTPMSFLRQVRLEHAHRDLQAADPRNGDTVAEIAARWGFARADRFAAAHRATYGELPSRTLRT